MQRHLLLNRWVPVNYAIPATALTARCVQNAVMRTLGRVPVQFTMRLRHLNLNSRI